MCLLWTCREITEFFMLQYSKIGIVQLCLLWTCREITEFFMLQYSKIGIVQLCLLWTCREITEFFMLQYSKIGIVQLCVFSGHVGRLKYCRCCIYGLANNHLIEEKWGKKVLILYFY